MKKVRITQYKWEGKWGPFKIKSKCDECNLTTSVLKETIKNYNKKTNVKIIIKPWLDNWWFCLKKGAFHPPIIMINNIKFHQFSKKNPLFNPKKLICKINQLGK